MSFCTGTSDFSIGTDGIQIRPTGDPEAVAVAFLTDEIIQEANESLTLHLAPTPSTLQTIPIGEAVFFRNTINLTIMDADCKFWMIRLCRACTM